MKSCSLRIYFMAGMAMVFCCLPLSARDASMTFEKLLESGSLDEAKAAIETTGSAAQAGCWRSTMYFYGGDYAAAETAIDAVVAAEPGVDYQRLKAYYRTMQEIHREDVETESAHFRFRAQGADRMLARYALDCLEKAYRDIGGLLGYYPEEKVLVEVYPRKEVFSLGSTLAEDVLEKSGTVGICKFGRIMILSPGALPLGYSWLDTLAHEYTHFMVNRMSRGACPLWLHEGIARYYDTMWRSQCSEYLTPDAQNHLNSARKKKSFIAFKRMHPSIVYLNGQDEMSLAFAEVSAAVDFMRRDFGGEDAVRRLLRSMPGTGVERSFKKALGVSMAKFEKRFFASIDSMPLAESRGIVGDQAKYDAAPEDESVGADQRGVIRLGDRMRQAGRPDGALVQYEKARAVEPDNPVILVKIARAYAVLGNGTEAEKMLRQAIEKNPGYVTPYQVLGELHYNAGRYADAAAVLERSLAINPFHPGTHRCLSRCQIASGNQAGAVYELQAAIALDPSDGESRVLLDRLSREP